MARKNIKKRHKHKREKPSDDFKWLSPALILVVPVTYLAIVIAGAVNAII